MPHKKSDKAKAKKDPLPQASDREQQLALRRQFGVRQDYQLANLGSHPIWSDFHLTDPATERSYRLAVRGTEPGDNFCTCLDFRTNNLGTCKHLEWTLHELRRLPGHKDIFKAGPLPRTHSSLAVDYQKTRRRLRLYLGGPKKNKIRELARSCFTEDGLVREDAWLDLDQFIARAKDLTSSFHCYPDALDLIIERRDDERRKQKTLALRKLEFPFADIIKGKLYPFQREGALFAFRYGRTLLADDLGLGKTLQAITAAELFRQELGIESVFVICPEALTYQWRAEIEKFTHHAAVVVRGSASQRRQQYDAPDPLYKILSYGTVALDHLHLATRRPDVIILDEAQRIRRYATGIAQAVKRLRAPLRIALTGAPLEDDPESLYSIVQFLDQHRLGPLWKLRERHERRDEHGKLLGYQHLEELPQKLAGLLLRRRRKEVRKQLPARVEQHLLVPMTSQQMALHEAARADLDRLVAKWQRKGTLSEKNRQRLLDRLEKMRRVCGSTALLRHQHRHDTKIHELLFILESHLGHPQARAVVFSQWEQMTRLVGQELRKRKLPFLHLPANGTVGAAERHDPDASPRIVLATDSTPEILHSERATLLVNLDLPWDPAVWQDRIDRVYPAGRERGGQVINLISEGTIEHRLAHLFDEDSGRAAAPLDTDGVFMTDRNFVAFMDRLVRIRAAPVAPSAGQAVSDTDVADLPRAVGSGPASLPLPDPVPVAAQQEVSALLVQAEDWLDRLDRILADPASKEALLRQIKVRDNLARVLRLLSALLGK